MRAIKPRFRISPSRLLLLFVLAAVVAIVVQTWWTVTQDKNLVLQSERVNGLVAARLLQEHARQTLYDAVRRLDRIAANVQSTSSGKSTPALTAQEIVQVEDILSSSYLKALQYIDPNGNSWISSPDYPTHQVNIADRDYVRRLLASPQSTAALIGHPYPSRYDSQLVIPVARNILDGAGNHIGLISVDIRLSYFADFYTRVARDNNACVSLVTRDGYVILRSPFEARFLDRDLTRHPRTGWLKSAATEGDFFDDDYLDDELPRLYSYSSVADFPLLTLYGRDFDSILSAWKTRRNNRIAFSTTIILLICVLTYFLLLHIRRIQKSQVSLVESERRFSAIFQQSPVPLVLVNLNANTITEVNDTWLRLFGFLRHEVVGRPVVSLNIWFDIDERTDILRELKDTRGVLRRDAHLRHKDGTALICLVSAATFTSGENLWGIFGALDVTRQRQAENEIRSLNLELEARVRSRTETLERTNGELAVALASVQAMQAELIRSEKLAALGTLVAGVAHELNTPIGTGVTVASTLHDEAEALTVVIDAGRLKRSVLVSFLNGVGESTALLLRTLQRAANLIHSFRQLAIDQSSDARRRFDLRQVLKEVALTLRTSAKAGDDVLRLELSPSIEMDSFPGALEQIVTNLYSNAILHGFEGRTSGTMELKTTASKDGWVEIVFSDDGVGIAAANLSRIFDPFFTTKLGQGGSGLGLHIAYNLATTTLGGKIEVASEPGRGTKVTLSLPMCAPRGEASRN